MMYVLGGGVRAAGRRWMEVWCVQRGGGLLAMEIVAPFACLKKRSQNIVAAGCGKEKYCSGRLMNSTL